MPATGDGFRELHVTKEQDAQKSEERPTSCLIHWVASYLPFNHDRRQDRMTPVHLRDKMTPVHLRGKMTPVHMRDKVTPVYSLELFGTWLGWLPL